MTGAGRVRVELAAQARWYTLGVSAAALRRLIVILLCLAGAAGPARAQSGDVNVVLDQFGVGSAFRSGSFVGIRLKLTPAMESELPEATAVWVQWELPNVDGDIAEYGRPAMLTRGRSTREWLYAPLPPEPATTLAGTVWPVRVFTWEDGRTGRELGGARISPSAANATGFSARTTMIGVVGSPQMELSQYATTGPGREVYGGHEAVRIVFGIQPPDLPDRWEGLRCFQAIAWSDALPQDLPAAQAEALREWIRRGGHLIISLPEDTNPWGLGEIGRTDFDDLLPCRGRAPRRDEDVPVAALRPIFSKAQAVRTAAGASLSLRVFRDLRGGFDVIDNHYEPLIALPDGRVVVIQRNFGHGRISVIGIDLSSGSLGRALFSNGTIGDLPQADVFWNRILGWRRDTPTTGELTRINEAKRLVSPPTQRALASGKLFLERINMSAAAGAGLLLALVLFSAYWLVAGPLGFYVLKQQRQVKHAWLAFAAAAALFTALAWGGVGLLRRSEIKVRHVTFLDHIARVGTGRGEEDPQLQRARSWFSVYIPGYADVAVGIESAPALGTAPPQRDLLASWTPPGETLQRFPDVDRYTIDVSRDTDDYALPARSTATQMHADWMGGLDPDWGGLLRSDPDDPVRVEIDPTGREELRGSIINGLPGDLVNVTMIWVWNRRFATRRYAWSEGAEQAWVEPARSGQMLNAGRMWREPILEVGSTYLLPEASDRSALSTNINQRYVRPFEDRGGWAGGGAPAGIPSEA
ncbi:MAG: hypothetical protein SYC29_15230, partial [Planctomycetota bacterium]|nr:hypothetical protein [Planctomycetota bacterium]